MANIWELIDDDTEAPFSKINFCMVSISTSIAIEGLGLSMPRYIQRIEDIPTSVIDHEFFTP